MWALKFEFVSLWSEKIVGTGWLTAAWACRLQEGPWILPWNQPGFSALLYSKWCITSCCFLFSIQPLLCPPRVYGSCRVYTTQNSNSTKNRGWDQAAASSLISLHVSGFTQDTACLLILFTHMLSLAIHCCTRHNVPSEDDQVFHSSNYSCLNGWECHREWLLSCGHTMAPKWDRITAYLRDAPWAVSISLTVCVCVMYRVLIRHWTGTQERDGPPWKKIYRKQGGKWSLRINL